MSSTSPQRSPIPSFEQKQENFTRRVMASILIGFLTLPNSLLVSASTKTPTVGVHPLFFDSNQHSYASALTAVTLIETRGGSTDKQQTQTDDTSSSTTPLPVLYYTEADLSDCAKRAHYVRDALVQRLHYVESGQRTRDFAAWARQRKGELGIIADDGDYRDLDFGDGNRQVIPYNAERKDPFAPERMNLDLFSTEQTPPTCYKGATQREIDMRPPMNYQLVLRAFQLGLNFAPVLSTLGIAALSENFRKKTWYPWLASCIGKSGAAFIKWGQWSSTRSDMFPEALCDELAKLHNDAPAHSWEFSEKVVESSLGLIQGSLGKVFDEFDEKPIASGSIAQVHKAVLDGTLVAVKIRHPNVDRLINMDFRIMETLARALDYIPALSWLHIRESVEQFHHTMAAQAHLNVEAHHLEVLNHNFRNWKQVKFPTPFYASSDCIIETFETGTITPDIIDRYEGLADYINLGHIQGYLKVDEPNDGSPEEETDREIEDSITIPYLRGQDLMPVSLTRLMVTTGLGIYLKMLLVDNLMHADLHPGNILVDFVPNHKGKDDSAYPEQARITLVDAGMVAKLTREESDNFIGMVASLGEGDGREAAKFALRFFVEQDMDEKAKESFADDMEKLFAERCRGYGTNVDVGSVLRGVLGIIREHQVRIDANFATLVINILCLESLSYQVCPSYNLLDFSQPILQSYRRICYNSDGSPKPREHRAKWLNVWLSLMHIRKSKAEDTFFRQQLRRRPSAHMVHDLTEK